MQACGDIEEELFFRIILQGLTKPEEPIRLARSLTQEGIMGDVVQESLVLSLTPIEALVLISVLTSKEKERLVFHP